MHVIAVTLGVLFLVWLCNRSDKKARDRQIDNWVEMNRIQRESEKRYREDPMRRIFDENCRAERLRD
jgi:hypothetical protein